MLFLSYSRGNLVVVRSVAAELRRLGYRTWLDLESLRPGERWKEAIDRAMTASDAMIYCISRLSLESAWTSVELRQAFSRGLPVIPLLLDDAPIEELPPSLRDLHIIVSTDWPRTEMPAMAARAIAQSVGRPPVPDSWCETHETSALRVELRITDSGDVTVGWSSAMWNSPPDTLRVTALGELARAADEVRAAELYLDSGVDPTIAALVLGTLSSRLGAARVRIHVGGELCASLSDAARRVQAVVA